MKSFQLREQSQTKINEARSTEDAVKANELFTEAKALAERANQLDEMEALERSFDQVVNKREVEDRSAKSEDDGIAAEIRDLGRFIQTRGEERGQTIKTADEGGVSVPVEISSKLITTAVDFGPMLDPRYFSVTYPSTGRDVKHIRARGNRKARVIEEAASASELTQKLDSVTLKTFTLTTDIAFASNELIQDTAIDAVNWLTTDMAVSYGLGSNEYLTVGNGTSQPMGIATALKSKAVVFADFADADAPSREELEALANAVLKLQYGVNAPYRRNGRYMFNSKTEMLLRLYKDADGRSIWQNGLQDGAPSKIHGKEVIINDDMPDLGVADEVSVIFGDTSNYHAAVARDLSITKLVESFATKNSTGWVGHARLAGNVVNPDAFAALKGA